MATIQYVISAINNASRVFDDIARSGEKLQLAMDGAREASEKLDAGLLATNESADKAKKALDSLAASIEIVAGLGGKGIKVPIEIDATQAMLDLDKFIVTAKTVLDKANLKAKLSFDVSQAAVASAATQVRGFAKANPITLPIVVDVSNAAVMRAVVATRAVLRANPITVPIQLSVSQAEILRVAAVIRSYFRANPVNVPVNIAWSASAASALGSLAALTVAQKAAGAAAANSGNQAMTAGIRWYGFWGILRGINGFRINLFGTKDGKLPDLLGGFSLPKLIADVGGMHLLVDAVAEVLAVFIPATFALGAFGVAAGALINDMNQRIENMATIAGATNAHVSFLTEGLDKLSDAVKPEVYQIFGDALNIVSSRASAFGGLAVATGHVLDNFAARIEIATTKTGVLDKTLKNGPQDLQLLGNSFGALGTIIGNVIKAVPGYAMILLGLGAGFLELVAKVSGLIIPVIHAGLALHGMFLYVGLAVTLGAKLIEWAGLAAAALAGLAEKAAGAFAFMAANPVLWIPIAIAAIAGLVYWFAKARTATQSFTDSLQKLVMQAPVQQALTTILTAQAQVTARLAAAQVDLAVHNQNVAQAQGQNAQRAAFLTDKFSSQQQAVTDLKGSQGQLSGETQVYNQHLAELGKQFGGVKTATGWLTVAGITTKQMLDKSSSGFAILKAQVAATIRGYAAMGVQAGVVGNDLMAMNKVVFDQWTSMQKLNQAWQTQIAAVTGTQSSFDTFQLGLITLGKNFKSASAASNTTTHSIDGLKSKVGLAGAAMDGLSQASLTVNQAFAGSITNGDALIGTWRQAGIDSKTLTIGVKNIIAPMLKFAQGSQEATDQLIALAQEAGYRGVASLQGLTTWLGKTHDATQKVKEITNSATQQELLLTGAMQNQGKVIANQLIGDINQAILKYDGVQKAAVAYGNAVAKDGVQSQQAHAQRQTLIDDLEQSGIAAGDSNKKIATMIATVLKIPEKKAMQIVMDGIGKFRINQVGAATLKTGGPTAGPQKQGARGMMVAGGLPGQDSVTISAMRGEVVVPKSLVDSGAVDHLRGQIPGMAKGGVVGGGALSETGNLQVLSGEYASKQYKIFSTDFSDAMVAAMEKALKSAEAKAKAAALAAASGAPGMPGPGGGAPSANAALARKLYPPWGSGPEWTAWNSVAMRESGWSNVARNQSSGAYGIPQALPPSKMGAAANPPESNPTAQINWMVSYIRGRYGDPIGAEAHEISAGWYDNGGLLKPGLTLAVNNTGKPEMVVPSGKLTATVPGLEPVRAGGASGLPMLIMGYGPNVTTMIKAAVTNITPPTGPIGPVGGGAPDPTKNPAPPKLAKGEVTFREHYAAVDKQRNLESLQAKQERINADNKRLLLKTEADHGSKVLEEQLKNLIKVGETHAKNLGQAADKQQKVIDKKFTNPLPALLKQLNIDEKASKADKNAVKQAIKNHASPEFIAELKKLEKATDATTAALKKRVAYDEKIKSPGKLISEPIKTGPPVGGKKKKKGAGSGGTGKGGGATATGGGTVSMAETNRLLRQLLSAEETTSRDVREVVAAVKALPPKEAAALAKELNGVAKKAAQASLHSVR